MIISFTQKRTGENTVLSEQMRQKTPFLTQIKPIERANDVSRIRRNVDNSYVKDSSATLMKRFRRQTNIVTNGKSY